MYILATYLATELHNCPSIEEKFPPINICFSLKAKQPSLSPQPDVRIEKNVAATVYPAVLKKKGERKGKKERERKRKKKKKKEKEKEKKEKRKGEKSKNKLDT